MTPAQLLEATAKAIEVHRSIGCPHALGINTPGQRNFICIKCAARAALTIALDAAAEVARGYADPNRDTLGYQEAENIMAAIRALKPGA